jgi:UDP-glucose 4-epimerase
VYNTASEDWITVDEVADKVIKAMRLSNVRKTYKPVLHGVGWPGDVKKIALKMGKIMRLRFKPAMNSREAVRATTRKLLEEINANTL